MILLKFKHFLAIFFSIVLIFSSIPTFSAALVVHAGAIERQNALASLTLAETIVYVGNHGYIGMDDAAHPSILYRLLDAKTNNDNSLIGSTDELVSELNILEQTMGSMVAEDNDYELIQEESLVVSGYTFKERIDILNQKMNQIALLLPECGINNVEQQELVIFTCNDVQIKLDELSSLFVVPVIFPDPVLDSIIRTKINKPTGDIYPEELLPITLLFSIETEICDLSGLEYCKNLQTLNFNSNNIADLSPLSGLTNLQSIYLQSNPISDLSPIAGLTKLRNLFITQAQISDITPLAHLTSLNSVALAINQISDLTPLAGLTNLRFLDLEGNAIDDLTPLAGLNLAVLYLSANKIIDISPLSSQKDLWDLYLAYNQISDISPLLDCYIHPGGYLRIRGNPLNADAQAIIDELVSRGIDIWI